MLAAFLASLVEFVEALTVVLAVGVVRGWRFALLGSACALFTLGLLFAVCGRSLAALPLTAVHLGVGALVLLLGLRWLRKAALRAAGLIPLHDEAAEFARKSAALTPGAGRAGWDRVAFAAAFKIVMLEGLEVAFIVVAIAAHGALWPGVLGALAALAVVIGLGMTLHRPLARVPENTLKFIVGLLLSAFGTFWIGEGWGLQWPGGDFALGGLFLVYLLAASWLVARCRGARLRSGRGAAPPRGNFGFRVALRLTALFVDDGWAAAVALLWALAGWAIARTPAAAAWQCVVFGVGFATLWTYSSLRAVRPS